MTATARCSLVPAAALARDTFFIALALPAASVARRHTLSPLSCDAFSLRWPFARFFASASTLLALAFPALSRHFFCFFRSLFSTDYFAVGHFALQPARSPFCTRAFFPFFLWSSHYFPSAIFALSLTCSLSFPTLRPGASVLPSERSFPLSAPSPLSPSPFPLSSPFFLPLPLGAFYPALSLRLRLPSTFPPGHTFLLTPAKNGTEKGQKSHF